MKQNNDLGPNSENEDKFNEQNLSHSARGFEDSQERVIPVIEESVHIDKKWVESGKINIVKSVTEQDEVIDIPLSHEEVNVERVEVNKYVDTLPPPVRYEGDTMIIPVLKEVVVKRVMVVEELRVTKKEVQTHEQQHVTIKKEEVKINRSTSANEKSE